VSLRVARILIVSTRFATALLRCSAIHSHINPKQHIAESTMASHPPSWYERQRRDRQSAKRRRAAVSPSSPPEPELHQRYGDEPPASTYDDIIKVLVGTGNQNTFSVHKDIICAKSKFFKTAFMNTNGNWRETEEKLMPLPDVDPELFRTYVNWLYTGKICWSPTPTATAQDHSNLIEAYILGDFLDDTEFRKLVMQFMVAGMSVWEAQFEDDHILRIWEATPEDSPLRNYTLVWMASKWRHGEVSEMVKRHNLPNQFFEQFAVVAMQCMDIAGRLDEDEREELLREQVFDLI
jgi:hypothetical protein